MNMHKMFSVVFSVLVFMPVYAADSVTTDQATAATSTSTDSTTSGDNSNSKPIKLFNFHTANKGNGVSFTDPQKPIVVKQSSPSFNLILQANPTTGYTWSLKDYNANIIKPIGRKYYQMKPGLIGSGGYEKWSFAVKTPAGFAVPQTTSITLIYARPWDLQGAQAINFKVVTVNDN